MPKYIVQYEGETEVDAECSLEAECVAASLCRPDNCRVVSSNEEETWAKEDEDAQDK